MKKILILLLIFSLPITAQIIHKKETKKTFCETIIKKTQNELKDGHATLLLIGGIAPITYDKDAKFKEDFNMKFFDYGCIPPNYQCILENNMLIFKYLDKKFGNNWRKEIRPDVIGLKIYISKNKI